VFKWLKNLGAASTPGPAGLAPARQQEPSMKEVFEDATLFTDWVDEYLIRSMPWRNDFDVLPDEAAQRNLNITFEQRERLVKEHSVLRIVGALVLVHERYGSERYQGMLSDIAGRLAGALEFDEPNAKGTLGHALDDYARGAMAGDFKALSILYMRRVYDDSDHYIRMLHAGIGKTAVIEISSSYEVIRDHYFKTVVGHSYETDVLLRKRL
jgi:hypothetical protein